MGKRLGSFLLALMLTLNFYPVFNMNANAATEYTVNDVTIPVWGKDYGGTYRQFYDKSPSYGKSQCWAFAQMVYQQLWDDQKFTSYRGTSDDMLRNVSTGEARAITAGNTKKFIQTAALGAVIRIASDINGADGVPTGTHKHSFILVQKDEDGFTVYHSGSTYVRLQYFTWAGFTNQYAKNYKYFKYIKWPGASALNIATQPTNVSFSMNKTTAAVGETLTFTASSSGAAYYRLVAKSPSGESITVSPSFSSSTTYTVEEAGQYIFTVSAVNSAGETTGTAKTIEIYSGSPTVPSITLSTPKAIVGQTVTISYGSSKNAENYTYSITKDGAIYMSGFSVSGDSLYHTFPEGFYNIRVNAVNPFGIATAESTLLVQGTTASGQCGANATWTFDSNTGLLAISGIGAIDNYKRESLDSGNYISTAPWQSYANAIREVEVGEGITAIGQYSFAQLQNLNWITLPESSLESINYAAFYWCDNLKGTKNDSDLEWLVIPPSVKKLEGFSFAKCISLKYVYFNQGGEIPEMTETTFIGCSEELSLVGQAVSPPPYGYENWCLVLQDVRVYLEPNGGELNLESANGAYYGGWYKEYGYVMYAHPYGDLPIPERRGYTFLGWYSKPKDGTLVTSDSTLWNPFWHTIYARWEKNEYTVNLANYEGGDEVMKTIAVDYMDEYGSLPMPSVEDAVFIGWSTSPDGGEIITEDSFYTLTEDQTLYATWEYIPEDPSDDPENTNDPANPPAVKENPFVDVPGDAFYHDPVLWAVDNAITNGVDATHFGPEVGCTRAHVVTFLWRAAGCPAPSSGYNPFADVIPGSYYYDAVLWAVEQGITNGTSATTFSPDQTCTRGQIVTFLWRYQDSPAAAQSSNFADVSANQYYSTAVAWAVANGITNGMGDGTFAPDATCTRGQIVTFLYRAMA